MSTTTEKRKATVRRNRWGNWRGYVGGRFVKEFACDVAHLVASDTAMPQSGAGHTDDMPEAARKWLAERNGTATH